MPTDHACHSAAEVAAETLDPLRTALLTGTSGDGRAHSADTPPDGAAGLLAFLDGLFAELHGALTPWHSTVGGRIRDAAGVPAPGGSATAPARQPSGWEALGLVRTRAEAVLTALAHAPGGGAAGMAMRLNLVEDILAGALGRVDVPADQAAHCAAGLAEATGSLFGLRPAHRQRPAPQPSPDPVPPAFPRMSDWMTGGLP
ncbi:hypothetical protein [Streptomyces sp. HUAS TT20]|uniref:hypothetical protein n=1 Tax=Streptomyces sp. HUAS TT20 TaxID=3447509 RepID=UPI0021DA674F|nr:hypothetical protein [Streptomyces sp. HUAS 15-9]UXY32046.1 hypothetical protein N8I87_39505 [Streptomyces sp. HUAS 15-9]